MLANAAIFFFASLSHKWAKESESSSILTVVVVVFTVYFASYYITRPIMYGTLHCKASFSHSLSHSVYIQLEINKKNTVEFRMERKRKIIKEEDGTDWICNC